MKSIEEKARETYPAFDGDLFQTSNNRFLRQGFEEGANYVLKTIESLISDNRIQNIKDVQNYITNLKS